MPTVLLANDDGADSPALVPFARALAALGTVRVVVPDRERSWIGKAITRFEPVTVATRERDGITVHACSGTPADGVQLGIHTLWPDRPDLVVTGINLGYNHGAGFLLSSGTVGAAAEGWLAGIPAVAVSTGVLADFPAWRRRVEEPHERPAWERLARLAATLVGEVTASGLTGTADVVSINLPYAADERTPRRITDLAQVAYEQLFHPAEEGYVHGFAGGFRELAAVADTDVDAANRGEIAITPLRMPTAVPVDEAIRRRLEGPTGAGSGSAVSPSG